MMNLNFVANMTQHFLLGKRRIRYFSNFSKLVEHRNRSPVREVKGARLCDAQQEFAEILKVSDESLGRDETLHHTCTSHEI